MHFMVQDYSQVTSCTHSGMLSGFLPIKFRHQAPTKKNILMKIAQIATNIKADANRWRIEQYEGGEWNQIHRYYKKRTALPNCNNFFFFSILINFLLDLISFKKKIRIQKFVDPKIFSHSIDRIEMSSAPVTGI